MEFFELMLVMLLMVVCFKCGLELEVFVDLIGKFVICFSCSV